MVARRTPLVRKLLLLDGIGRSGKFLAANILNGFADVEPAQLRPVLEHLPYFEALGLMDKRTAEELLHHEVDIHAYEMLIGRNLNYRVHDQSSIFNVADPHVYLRRPKEKDTNKELKRFWRRGAWSLFLVHETLPDARIFFDAFPQMKVITVARDPIDLVYSWYTRRTMDRWTRDPTFFNVPLQGKRGVLPWYMYPYIREYESLAPMDQTIFIMDVLFRRYDRVLRQFSSGERRRILRIRYEDILERPQEVLARLGVFLKKKPLPGMRRILKREKLPTPVDLASARKKKLAFIEKKASRRFFNRLLVLEANYYAKNR